MQTFKALKPCKAKIIIFVIVLICLCVIPVGRSEYSPFGSMPVPPVALLLGILINSVDSESHGAAVKVIGYAFSVFAVFFFIYLIACLLVEGCNLIAVKRRGK